MLARLNETASGLSVRGEKCDAEVGEAELGEAELGEAELDPDAEAVPGESPGASPDEACANADCPVNASVNTSEQVTVNLSFDLKNFKITTGTPYLKADLLSI